MRKRVYKYDTDGLRTLKKIGDDEYKYTYINGQLYAYETGDMYMFFTYNDDGTPLGIIFNGIAYYYQTNLQGDVIGIVRNDGEKVASYSYDAWGSPVGDVPTSGVGRYNPLRYRGYVYDEDTGWYYLQSRYYDPEVGRFINADDVTYLGASGTVLGYNLFSYCENNPINHYDFMGYASVALVGAGIQIEIRLGILTGGIEIVWFFSSRVNVGGKSRWIPYVYVYGGGIGTSASTKAVLNKIIKKPSLLFNPKSLVGGFSLSVCVFAIFGYSNFKSPKSYLGRFDGIYASVWHVKTYTSWSNICFVVGVGWSSNFISAGYSNTRYVFASMLFSNIGNLYNSVVGKAKTL